VILTAVDFSLISMFCARLAWQRCCALGDIAQRDSTGIVIQARNDFSRSERESFILVLFRRLNSPNVVIVLWYYIAEFGDSSCGIRSGVLIVRDIDAIICYGILPSMAPPR
jgi:hypothetical protein